MKIFNASDAKREFSEVLLNVQREPVKINKNGKPVAVVLSVSEYNQLQTMREKYLQSAINAGVADFEVGKISSGEKVLKRLRKRIS